MFINRASLGGQLLQFKPGVYKGWSNLKAIRDFFIFWAVPENKNAGGQTQAFHGGMSQEITHQAGGMQFPETHKYTN